MPRLNELDKSKSLVGLVFGPAGSGKTELCATAGSRSLFINIGRGIATFDGPGFKNRNPGYNPIVEEINEAFLPDKATGHDQLCDVLDSYLNRKIKNFKEKDFNEFDWVIVDDATALKRMAMNLGLEIMNDLGKSNSLVQSRKHGQRVVAVQDYGEEMDIVDKFLIDYITLCQNEGKHFILTAHERLTYKTKKISEPPVVDRIRPGFTGQTFPDGVQGHFDFTWYLETQGGGDRVFYYARTKGDSTIAAKTRWDGLVPERWQNPNLKKLLEAKLTGKPILK